MQWRGFTVNIIHSLGMGYEDETEGNRNSL